MNKKRVKMLDSIAGLGDPKPVAVLDEKYANMRTAMKKPGHGREKGISDYTIETVIAETKKRDRYGEQPIGFARDWALKPDAELMINADLADKWEAAGICVILTETKRAA